MRNLEVKMLRDLVKLPFSRISVLTIFSLFFICFGSFNNIRFNRRLFFFGKAEEIFSYSLSFINPVVEKSGAFFRFPPNEVHSDTLDQQGSQVAHGGLVMRAASSETTLPEKYEAVLKSNTAVLSAGELETAKMLIDLNQEHLFTKWPEAGIEDKDKRRMLQQVMVSNSKYPGGLAAYVSKARQLLAASAAGINPFEGYSPSVPEGETLVHGTEAFRKAEEKGLEAACKAGFVLVAGGLGERLGYSGIKLSLPVELTSNRTYLQVYVDYIMALQQLCRDTSGDSTIQLPLVIMTSDDTDALTRALISENANYGMQEGQLRIIKQDKVPALGDSQAHFVLSKDDPYALDTKPHGHGDVHQLLLREGIAKGWEKNGLEWVFFLQDTNALVINSILPALGVSASNSFHMNTICIPRKAKEEAGAITKLTHVDGSELIINVEYNQLDPLLKASVSKDGDVNDPNTGFSPFPGNTNNLVFHLPTYYKVLAGEDQGIVTEFVNPKYKDSTRTEFKKPTRLECMMQDYPKLMAKELGNTAKIGFTTLDKWMCFSPAKNSVETGADNNKKGVPPATISSAEAEHYAAITQKLVEVTKANIEPASPVEFAGVGFDLGPRIVLKPSFAVTSKQLSEKIKNSALKVSSRSTLILDGQGITIDSLDLDGALKVMITEGVSLKIEGLTVRNKGWQFRALSEEEQSIESNAIRGYILEKLETREIVISEPGRYVINSSGVISRETQEHTEL